MAVQSSQKFVKKIDIIVENFFESLEKLEKILLLTGDVKKIF